MTRTLERWPMERITPYDNNPRLISADDVGRIAESIRTYGYQAPIIVNAQGVIVVGHARYAALQRLGVTEVNVLVTDLPPDKEAEYRVIDNRAGELVTWDHELLLPELREFANPEHLAMFFPEIDLSLDFSAETFTLDEDDIERAAKGLAARLKSRPDKSSRITCPHCGHVFAISR